MIETKGRLNRAERLAAVGQLVASVAHEVGTPLHSIAWHVQALAEEPSLTSEMRKRIAVIEEQLTRVVRIIQDLLSSTRPRRPEPKWVPVAQVITPAAVLMEPVFHAKGVSLAVEIPELLPLLWADDEKMHQVMVNLLDNALAATSAGGTVKVSAEVREATLDEGDRWRQATHAISPVAVVIKVRDTGCGMPEADAQRAFEPFFTTKADGRGTGLGLFLSRETVMAHGGELTLVTEMGRGTTVFMTLPGLPADAETVTVKKEQDTNGHDGGSR